VRAVASRHGLELAAVKKVHHERLERIVTMVPERDLIAAEALRGGVEDPAAKARAERAVGAALFDVVDHHAIGVFAEYLELAASRLEILAERRPIVAGLHLIEMHGDDIDRKGKPWAQEIEEMQERIAILTAAHSHEDAIAGRKKS